MSKEINKAYFRRKLKALRNAIDETLMELGDEQPTPQRQRRNLKEARVLEIESNYAEGTWKKPKQLRKVK